MYPSPKKHSENQNSQALFPLAKISQVHGVTNIEHNRNNRKDLIGDL
jgi:hypothetical protein